MANANTTVKDYCYFQSGALRWEIPYRNHYKHGIEKWYYKSGALESETLYVDGVCHSNKIYYYIGGLTKRTVTIWTRDAARMAPIENFL